MNSYDSRWNAVIPPFIRGLTYDGIAGQFVRVLTDGEVPAGMGEISVDTGRFEGNRTEEVLERVEREFAEFIAANGRYPATVALGGNAVLSIGSTVEEALSCGGSSRLPGEKRLPDRNGVVRGKIALVTGGAQGFGEGMVRELAVAGAYIYIADLNYGGAEALADELNGSAGREIAYPLEVNVTDEDSVEQMMLSVAGHTGGLDLLISNAGVLKAGSVKEMSLKDFSFVTAVDYTGFFLCTKYAARIMSIQNRASKSYWTDIVVLSSKSGLTGSNMNGAYAGAKFGTIGLTQSFALELVRDTVKVNAICPGNFLDGPLWADPDRGLFVQYLNAGKVPGAKTVGDVRSFYESKVPMNRGCTVADVMRALFYIVEQQYETGQAVPVTGGQIMLN